MRIVDGWTVLKMCLVKLVDRINFVTLPWDERVNRDKCNNEVYKPPYKVLWYAALFISINLSNIDQSSDLHRVECCMVWACGEYIPTVEVFNEVNNSQLGVYRAHYVLHRLSIHTWVIVQILKIRTNIVIFSASLYIQYICSLHWYVTLKILFCCFLILTIFLYPNVFTTFCMYEVLSCLYSLFVSQFPIFSLESREFLLETKTIPVHDNISYTFMYKTVKRVKLYIIYIVWKSTTTNINYSLYSTSTNSIILYHVSNDNHNYSNQRLLRPVYTGISE